MNKGEAKEIKIKGQFLLKAVVFVHKAISRIHCVLHKPKETTMVKIQKLTDLLQKKT
jgi:hypothetical protein